MCEEVRLGEGRKERCLLRLRVNEECVCGVTGE